MSKRLRVTYLVRPLEPDAVSTAEGRNMRETVPSLYPGGTVFLFSGLGNPGWKVKGKL
jgi:hypothetical protein